jgi:hypothetical protein
MANTAGMYQLSDLLAVRNASAASFGLDLINQTLQSEVAYANKTASEMMSDFVQKFDSQSAVWGGGGSIAMEKMDEFGTPLASHSAPGITAQFPVHLFKQRLGWNREYFKKATPAEVASKFLELRKGYFNALISEMRRSLYGYGNGITSAYSFVDRLTNGVTLTLCKGLQNGAVDTGCLVPDSPGGTAFATTHCHLNFNNGMAADAYTDCITHVVEHGNTKGLKCIINRVNLAELEALTTIYTPLSHMKVEVNGQTLAVGNTSQKLDYAGDYENQLVGYLLGEIEVWVKPWAVAELHVVVATGMPEKVIGMRMPNEWHLAAPYDDYPLYAEHTEAEFGFAVFNRVMAAVSEDAAAWTVPSLCP